MIDNLAFLERSILETWGGTLNDLEDTSYMDLVKVLNAKEVKPKEKIVSGFDFFSKHSINDI